MFDNLRVLTALAALSSFAISACLNSNALFPACYGDETGCSVTGEGAEIFYQQQPHSQQGFNVSTGSSGFSRHSNYSSHNAMCGQHIHSSQNKCGGVTMGVRWIAVPTYHHVYVENLRPAPTPAPIIVAPEPVIEPYVAPTSFIEAAPYVPPTQYPSVTPQTESYYLPVRK